MVIIKDTHKFRCSVQESGYFYMLISSPALVHYLLMKEIVQSTNDIMRECWLIQLIPSYPSKEKMTLSSLKVKKVQGSSLHEFLITPSPWGVMWLSKGVWLISWSFSFSSYNVFCIFRGQKTQNKLLFAVFFAISSFIFSFTQSFAKCRHQLEDVSYIYLLVKKWEEKDAIPVPFWTFKEVWYASIQSDCKITRNIYILYITHHCRRSSLYELLI